jgi:hypothetical protein
LSDFLSLGEYERLGFVVETSACRIPALDPFHPSILPFLNKDSPPTDCRTQSRAWTYVNKSVQPMTHLHPRQLTIQSITPIKSYLSDFRRPLFSMRLPSSALATTLVKSAAATEGCSGTPVSSTTAPDGTASSSTQGLCMTLTSLVKYCMLQNIILDLYQCSA